MLSLIQQLRPRLFFRGIYWASRIGMALTFIISGTRKLPGVKFTLLPPSDPVGNYFQTMYDLGFYWNFIGYFQIAIGILAFFNRSVVAAILLMLPVTVNIFRVSVALDMRGTPLITAAMLLANFYLLFWHYENYIGILKKPIGNGPVR